MNIHYEFKNKKLLNTALTHISLANDKNMESNQRLEFLGDSILSYIIACEIYGLYKGRNEGSLTKIRAALVCEKTLAELSREMEIGASLRFGRSETASNGAHKDSILADAFEAVLGAIYLDSDIETARKWTLDRFGDRIRNIELISETDYKSELQIYFQKRDKNNTVVAYRLKEKSGPDHSPVFTVEAVYEGRVIGKGSGKNRKTAEQSAARQAFERLGIKINEKV